MDGGGSMGLTMSWRRERRPIYQGGDAQFVEGYTRARRRMLPCKSQVGILLLLKFISRSVFIYELCITMDYFFPVLTVPSCC
jgi:hypothetical protein